MSQYSKFATISNNNHPDCLQCAPGWAFDPRAFECRQCGLCCMDHQVIQACLDQTSDASHACYSDASCTDPVPVMPGRIWPLLEGMKVNLLLQWKCTISTNYLGCLFIGTPPPSADSGLNWTTIGPIVGGISEYALLTSKK